VEDILYYSLVEAAAVNRWGLGPRYLCQKVVEGLTVWKGRRKWMGIL
jgi:hypothetical protein